MMPYTTIFSPCVYPKSFHLRCSFSTSTSQYDNQESKGPAVVWFKHDLRVNDHPALVAAASNHNVRGLLPLYVFDRQILSRFSDEVLELVLYAVKDLRKSLVSQGSNLMVKFGNSENVIPELVKQVKATHIFAEEEVEYELRRMVDVVKKAVLEITRVESSPEFTMWQTPFYDIKSLNDVPASHDEFEKLHFPISPPLVTPTLPGIKLEVEWGSIPTFSDLREFIDENKSRKSWISIKDMAAETTLQKLLYSGNKKRNENISPSEPTGTRHIKESAFVTRKGNIVGGGTDAVLNALAAYLRYLEGTGRDDWQEVHEKLRGAENRDGASFTALFGSALSLGVVSRRTVYSEAIKYEKERNAGFISPFGYSAATVAASVNAVRSAEWYTLMALKGQKNDKDEYSIRIWKWNGFLVQYTVTGHEGPAILLVHGFGAFHEHYRDNVHGIAEGGSRVWSVTMIGFGRSEKPNVFYTELLWAELLRDFIVDVVGEPVHLVGNSIGGYFVAIVSGLCPALAKSLVLINSAGDIVPGNTFGQFTKDRKTSGAAWLGARLLSAYLRLKLKDIVKNCYPTKPERADDWLVSEMLRASYDPGALVLLESIFSINLSIPLNYLLEGLEDKVLIIQGMKDPISDSRKKLAMFREHFPRVVIRQLDAGHCPHDELPEEVNAIICEWVVAVESKILIRSIS